MRIKHEDAVMLESLVRKTCKCQRYGIGGLVDADVYVKHPMEAFILCIGWTYHNTHNDEISAFERKWHTIFDYPEDNAKYTIEEFIHELEELIKIVES